MVGSVQMAGGFCISHLDQPDNFYSEPARIINDHFAHGELRDFQIGEGESCEVVADGIIFWIVAKRQIPLEQAGSRY